MLFIGHFMDIYLGSHTINLWHIAAPLGGLCLLATPPVGNGCRARHPSALSGWPSLASL